MGPVYGFHIQLSYSLNSNLSNKGTWEKIGVKTSKDRIYFDPDKYSSLFLEVRVYEQYSSIYLPATYVNQIDSSIEKSFVVGGYQNSTYPGVWSEIKCGKMGTATQPYVYFNRGFVNGNAVTGDYGLALWGMLL